ncbi:MAG: aminoacyl-tRNA hydrolase [Desulfuromonadales bacterium]|nr:aminoacyl-tRNA hydrolase [Desulfuromonadales bacterium]NIR34089.1 aminoacyl-tRNA hydrolase [Desulfuromonadales bacterium]NIS40188.1 aminoacyl-tRNA hydrolase [Desulfuromonadales bacterium]
MNVVVGLGNPGRKYALTRHNVGFMVAEQLAGENGIALKQKKHQGIYGIGRVGGMETAVLLPQTYMNRSGISVKSAITSLGIQPGDLIVVHDEVDLPFGRVRVKNGGGHGGHNGLRSICDLLGSRDFIRVRVGVGRPEGQKDVSSHVLSVFSATEKKELDSVLKGSAMAVETVVRQGAQQAMNEFNNRLLTDI